MLEVNAGAFACRGHSVNSYQEPRRWSREGTSSILDKAESFYLRVLRAVILIIATCLLVYAGWLAAMSLYKISQSPDSVVEQEAVVAADELTDAEMPAAQVKAEAAGPRSNAAQATFYASFVDRYYRLYRAKFEPYRQREDKQLTKAEFDGAYLDTADRLKRLQDGSLSFENDKRDLETLLTVMTEAADKPTTIERLNRYKRARKVAVSTKVERTRTVREQGWDAYSTSCAYWYESPVGCSVTRTREIPYTETVTKMQYPEGTQSHIQIFRAFQDRFFNLLEERRTANANEAASKRQSILEGIVEGKLSLFTTLQILGGFLILMFFFLLIAIERHQRKLAQDGTPVPTPLPAE